MAAGGEVAPKVVVAVSCSGRLVICICMSSRIACHCGPKARLKKKLFPVDRPTEFLFLCQSGGSPFFFPLDKIDTGPAGRLIIAKIK